MSTPNTALSIGGCALLVLLSGFIVSQTFQAVEQDNIFAECVVREGHSPMHARTNADRLATIRGMCRAYARQIRPTFF